MSTAAKLRKVVKAAEVVPDARSQQSDQSERDFYDPSKYPKQTPTVRVPDQTKARDKNTADFQKPASTIRRLVKRP